MKWNELESLEELEALKIASGEKAQVIFKHSTRCSISKTAWSRLERAGSLPEEADYYYLDLIEHRNISDQISSDFDVMHESPQIIVIKDGKSIYDADHFGITVDDLEEVLS